MVVSELDDDYYASSVQYPSLIHHYLLSFYLYHTPWMRFFLASMDLVGLPLMMMVRVSASLTCILSCSAITHVRRRCAARVCRTQLFMAMVTMSLMTGMMPISTSVRCPSNCSTISPLPYPFGAAPGCGSPGFQLTNCSISTPLWNLSLAGTASPYYIKSISPSPNYGYGGTVLLYLQPSTVEPLFCKFNPPTLNNFTTSNFYAFQDANLTYYQDRYLFFNCTELGSSAPASGVLTPSSPSCFKYLSYCKLATIGTCLEYVPYKELQLAQLLHTYNCSFLRRFIITDEDAPVSTWVSLTQFEWGPVQNADSCSSCQSSGGTCGYDTQDNSFRCYCGNETYQTHCHHGSGSLVGIGVGVSVAAIFLLILVGVALYYRQNYFYYRLFRQARLKLDGLNQAPLEFPYGALATATKSFSTKIGQGGFGKVYHGVLFDGNEVAVKVLDASVSHTDEQFMNEVATIGNIHHVNVARLVGFCFEKSRKILVYEYVSNGSLEKYLFPSKQSSCETVLNWKQRYNIAVGIARGLCYMHEDCRSCIIHCDIKPQNILLDADFCPKISDFGLARLLRREESRVLTHARGTPGYVAPEFWSLGSGPLTAKFDVYSYGMVLLEIIRGKRCFYELDPILQEESGDEEDSWISMSVDMRMEHDVDLEQVELCTLVALWCIQDDPSLRPTMSRVVQFLQGTAPAPSKPPKPFQKMFHHGGSTQFRVDSSGFLLSSSKGTLSLTHSSD